jgi:hypothetical protein
MNIITFWAGPPFRGIVLLCEDWFKKGVQPIVRQICAGYSVHVPWDLVYPISTENVKKIRDMVKRNFNALEQTLFTSSYAFQGSLPLNRWLRGVI